MKRTLGMIAVAAVLAIAALAQSPAGAKAVYCHNCCGSQCGQTCCQNGCTDGCCQSK